MTLTFGVLGGLGLGLAYSATTPAAIKWFPATRKGLITGIVVGGVGIAAVIMSPHTQFLLFRTNISQTFLILDIGAAVAIILMAMMLNNPRARHARFLLYGIYHLRGDAADRCGAGAGHPAAEERMN